MERMREIESPSQPWQGHILTTKLHSQISYKLIITYLRKDARVFFYLTKGNLYEKINLSLDI